MLMQNGTLTQEQIVQFLTSNVPVLGRDYNAEYVDEEIRFTTHTEIGSMYVNYIKPKLLELASKLEYKPLINKETF